MPASLNLPIIAFKRLLKASDSFLTAAVSSFYISILRRRSSSFSAWASRSCLFSSSFEGPVSLVPGFVLPSLVDCAASYLRSFSSCLSFASRRFCCSSWIRAISFCASACLSASFYLPSAPDSPFKMILGKIPAKQECSRCTMASRIFDQFTI